MAAPSNTDTNSEDTGLLSGLEGETFQVSAFAPPDRFLIPQSPVIVPPIAVAPEPSLIPASTSTIAPLRALPPIFVPSPDSIVPDREVIQTDGPVPVFRETTTPPTIAQPNIVPDRELIDPDILELGVPPDREIIPDIEIFPDIIPDREIIHELNPFLHPLTTVGPLNTSSINSTNGILPPSSNFPNISFNEGRDGPVVLTTENSRICGFLGFCENSAYEACYNTSIISCEQCGMSRAAVFMLFAVFLGLAILLGNTLVLLVGYHRHKKGKSHKMDVCRSSLAVADVLTGIQLLVVTVYNFSWSVNSTAQELDALQLASRGSAAAYLGGIFYLFGYTSSVYHLFYIGLQRVYAVAKPIQYKWQSKSLVSGCLVGVWFLAAISAATPAMVPQHFTFSYNVPTLLFLPTVKVITVDQDYGPVIALLVVFFVLPYILMSVSTIVCGIFIKMNFVRRTRKLSERTRNKNKSTDKKKVRVFVTVAIMQLGFTVTLIPVMIVVSLFYSGYFTCSDFSTPYLVCFYLSMSNSLVNVIVYNIRDKMFRSSVVEIFMPGRKARITIPLKDTKSEQSTSQTGKTASSVATTKFTSKDDLEHGGTSDETATRY